MRANLRAGKLHPEPRSVEHARRRMQQLDHEIDGIRLARARKREEKPTRIEEELHEERKLTAKWIKEAMKMATKKKRELTEEQQKHTIVCALRVAADRYDQDEQTFRQAAEDIRNGKAVPMFPAGDDGVTAAKRLADQFYRQAEDARAVLLKLEGDEDEGDES